MAKFTNASWTEIEGMKHRVERLTEQVLGADLPIQRQRDRKSLWQPTTDVSETPDEFIIQIELSGMETDMLEIEVLGQDIWIHGERRMEKDVSGTTYHVLERSYGPFSREFRFHQAIDAGSIHASLKNGLLTIVVPKPTESGNKQRIAIAVE